MEESLAEYYYEQLKTTTNPVATLVAFYQTIFDLDSINSDTYKMFARLYKIYGRDLVYYSLLDCLDMENIDFEKSISRLISYFAKKRLEEKYNYTMPVDLTKMVTEFDKKVNPKRRIKVSNPFEEE